MQLLLYKIDKYMKQIYNFYQCKHKIGYWLIMPSLSSLELNYLLN